MDDGARLSGCKTFRDIVNSRKTSRLISVNPTQIVAEAVALMKKYEIEQIPVIENNFLMGSVSESGLFQKIFTNPEIKNSVIAEIIEPPYPVVDLDMPVERLGNLITKESGAVLAKDEKGDYQIVTKYDIIQSLAK